MYWERADKIYGYYDDVDGTNTHTYSHAQEKVKW